MRRRIRATVVAVVAIVATVLAGGQLPASAAGIVQGSIAGAVPPGAGAPPSLGPPTPNIIDGGVINDMQQMSNGHVVIAGTFTQVKDMATTGQPTLSRTSVFSYDPSTGKVDPFAPVVNGVVNAVWPGPTAGTVFLVGKFAGIAGSGTKNMALLNLADASPVAGFTAPVASGAINDIEVSGSEAYIGGNFTSVTSGGVTSPRGGLASFNPTTGALDGVLTATVTVTHGTPTGATAPVGVSKLDVRAAGDRMVIIGNFMFVNGVSHPQTAVLDIPSTGSATLDPWVTTKYTASCNANAYVSYVRDVQWSPDGTYFVIAATGGGGTNTNALCDAAARFNWPDPNPSNAQPYWVDWTGNDTFASVAISDAAVYVGGHQRWVNNPLASDKAGPGAVPRPGIVALDPLNGLPLSWNPGRNPRGVGAFSLLLTPAGLYVGSDTDWIGNHKYFRQKVAFFPLSNLPLASQDTSNLTNGEVFLAGTSGGSNNVNAWTYDGNTTTGTSTSVNNGGVPWSATRGGVWIGGNLYYGRQNPADANTWELVKQQFDGQTFGTATFLNTPYKDPTWDGVQTGSGGTYDGVFPNFYSASDLGSVSGMFYWNGRMYYTRTGSSSLFSRAFSVDSGIVGAQVATTLSSGFSNVSGMFINGGFLYTSNTSGTLSRRTFDTTTGAIGTTVTALSTPGKNWAARDVFIAPNPGTPVNHPPTASITGANCTDLTCSFTGSGSDPDSGDTITYAWNFGDSASGANNTSAVQNPSHTFSSAGTYTVSLTTTDNHGASSSPATRQVTVPPVTTPTISVVGSAGTTSGTQTSVSSLSVTLPNGIASGDGIVAAFTSNNTSQANTPTGYTLMGTQKSPATGTAAMTTAVFQRVADGSEGGTTLTVSLPAAAKGALQVIVYHGTSSSGPVASFAGGQDGSTTSHALPASPYSAGQWVLGVWADKSSAARTWTVPSGFTQENQQAGLANGGSISGLFADQSETSSGTASGTATTSATSTRGISITLVIAPGP